MFFPYRDDNPRTTTPFVTISLIAINTLVQIYQATMSPEREAVFIRSVGAIPLEITTLTDIIRFPDHPPALVPIPLTLFTAMFVHGGWLHLIGNMWYLWLFGDNIEDAAGHLKFLMFYLIAGLLAFAVQIAVAPFSTIPTVGASGAIAGVLGAYALRFPHARVRCLLVIVIFVQMIEVPAMIVLGFWFLLQVLEGFAAGQQAGVAWFAHIGGFIFGLLMAKFLVKKHGRSRS